MVVFFYGAYRHYDGGMRISFMWLSKSLSFESCWHHIWTFQMNFTMATMIDLFGKKYINEIGHKGTFSQKRDDDCPILPIPDPTRKKLNR